MSDLYYEYFFTNGQHQHQFQELVLQRPDIPRPYDPAPVPLPDMALVLLGAFALLLNRKASR